MLLYDNPMSSNALKVRFLLAELGLEYDRREVPISQPRPDWYLAENPLGGIPALQDGDLVLAESNAILRYLAQREGRADLYPAAPAQRAPVDEFLDRFATAFRGAFFQVERLALGFVQGRGFEQGPPDPEGARAKEAEVAATVELFERVVADNGTVVGSFTIADCAAAPVLFRTRNSGMDLTPYPKLLRLRETVTARDGFAAAGAVL
ncbi:MAG TPA: glutathione S-transferase family protein [Gaiellales bacterium]|nr:glutathione S-transferase family protein [Gaiellales bacterium]